MHRMRPNYLFTKHFKIMKHFLQNLLCALALLLVAQVLLSSCSNDDEPVMLSGYYLATDAHEFIGISENDEELGILLPPNKHSIHWTIMKMQKALRLAFPHASVTADDARAIAVCDSCFKQSSFYSTSYGDTVCTLKLIRTTQKGERVLSSQTIKYYRFARYPFKEN